MPGKKRVLDQCADRHWLIDISTSGLKADDYTEGES